MQMVYLSRLNGSLPQQDRCKTPKSNTSNKRNAPELWSISVGDWSYLSPVVEIVNNKDL
jgi:hypothetical protein